MSAILFSSKIGPVAVDCGLTEDHNSSIEITGNPIETGAEVNDHAFIKPKAVVLEIANYNPSATFNALVKFQESRQPFVLVTGLTVYKDMLIESIDAFRDKDNAHILSATVHIRQVIIVGSSATSASATGSPASLLSGAASALGGVGSLSGVLSNALPGGINSLTALAPSALASGLNSSLSNLTSTVAKQIATSAVIDRVSEVVKRGDSRVTNVATSQVQKILGSLV